MREYEENVLLPTLTSLAKAIEDEKRAETVTFPARADEGGDGVTQSKKRRVALCNEDNDNDEAEDNGDIQPTREAVTTELLEELTKTELHAFRQDKTSLLLPVLVGRGLHAIGGLLHVVMLYAVSLHVLVLVGG
jgi:hypothetical protein